MRTVPFPHQQDIFMRTCTEKSWALFMEMGTGKTKVAIDTFFSLYEEGECDALLVIAPNGVHENWVTDELPKHGWFQYEALVWHSKRKSSKAQQDQQAKVLHYRGPAIVTMTYEGFMTTAGYSFAKNFVDTRRTFMVCDESSKIKNPKAKRTKALVKFGEKAPYKRILTGTPVTKSPLDVYTQLKFLDKDFWFDNGFPSWGSFSSYYGIYQSIPGNGGRGIKVLIGHQNQDRLKAIVDTTSSRVTKDAVLDLPPKLYSKRIFELELGPQSKAYKALKDEFLFFLQDDLVSAPLALTRLLKLQQVTCGFVVGELNGVQELPNPRLKALKDLLEEIVHPTIIWARFAYDIDRIMELLGDDAVRYDGSTSQEDRLTARTRFQEGEVQYFVANPAAAGTGLTLHRARNVIYYSNSFDLEARLQSEDRAHRIGQEHPVNYIDILCKNTVDQHIVKALSEKVDLASQITGDRVRSWL